MKHQVSLAALALLMLASVGGASAQFQQVVSAVSPSGDTLYYRAVSDGNGLGLAVTFPNAVLSYYNIVSGDDWTGHAQPSGSLIIPDSVLCNGTTYPVVAIDRRLFYFNYTLTSVTLPNTIRTIGTSAFENCLNLSSVNIPASCTSIEESAFGGCSKLQSVTLPAIVNVGNYAFRSVPIVYRPGNYSGRLWGALCVNPYEEDSLYYYDSTRTTLAVANRQIHTVNIPGTVTTIGADAFYRCSNLAAVTIPSSVVTIGNNAFMICTGLTSVTIPSSVTSIGSLAFYGCDSLTSVTLEGCTPPTLDYNSEAFPDSCAIIVPCNCFGNYTAISEWSGYTLVRSGYDYTATADSTRGHVLIVDSLCAFGTVTFIAVPNAGYRFDHWSDGSTDSIHTVVLSGDIALVAYFDMPYLTLTALSANPQLGTTLGSSDRVVANDTVTIAAVPLRNVVFTGWSDGSTANPYSLAIDRDSTVTALFAIPTTDTVTLYRTDTIYIHDTVYIGNEGVDEADMSAIRLYQREGRIVVEGADGMAVRLFDVNGRQLAVRRNALGALLFDTPAAGTYLVQVGDRPARRVVVVR